MDHGLTFSEPQIVTTAVGVWTLRIARWDDVLVAQWICGAWTRLVEPGEA